MATNMDNSGEKLSEQEEKLLHYWNPPKVPFHDVYHRRGLFELNPGYKIHIITKTAAIRGEYEQLQLLEKQDIEDHMRRYNNLHIGLVQVAVKPLTRKGLNCSVIVCLRDCRKPKFMDSLLAVAESSLVDGPLYFDCYPDRPVSLAVSNTNILDTLTLNIRTEGLMNADGEGPGHVAVMYRICYKVLVGNNAKPKGRYQVPDQTTFVLTNLLRKDRVAMFETVKWGVIKIPRRFTLRTGTDGRATVVSF